MLDLLFNVTTNSVRSPQPVFGLFARTIGIGTAFVALAAISSHPVLSVGTIVVLAGLACIDRKLS